MKAFVKRYLRRRLPAFAVFLLCCAVFAATFYLYGFPLRAVAYPALLSLLFWGLHEAMNLYRAGKKHKSLSMLTAAWTDAMLPPVETVEDADYQRLWR